MDCKKNKQKHLYTITVLIAIIAICASVIAYKNNKEYKNTKNNKYNMAFFEVVGYMNNVEVYLAKSLITKEASSSSENLIQVWRESNLAAAYLAQVPVKVEGLSKTEKFLNQASEYTYALFRKNIKDKDLTDEELRKLKELHDYSIELKNTLNQLSEEINAERLNWDHLDYNTSTILSKENNTITKDGFDTIESNFEQYDGLIYDGAYSEHITNESKKGLTGNNIDEEKAKEIAINFVEESNIQEIVLDSLSENGNIECYTFTIILKNNKENPMTIAISKKGGHVVFSNYNKNIESETISEEKADEIAEKFLNSKGFTSLQKTYYTKESGIMTINYAYEQDNIIIYPDLIKIKIALDNGEILGIETKGYLNNHEKRNLNKENIISKEKAKQNINNDLKIESERLAVIPTEYKTEIFCWEFRGKIRDRDFLVYVNAKTGEIEDVLVVTDTGNGTFTM